jgi:hypothetical protein
MHSYLRSIWEGGKEHLCVLPHPSIDPSFETAFESSFGGSMTSLS